MAVEIQISIQIVDTEPAMPFHQGIMFRSMRTSTLTAPSDTETSQLYTIGRARLSTLVSEVEKDIDEQLHEIERSVQE